MSVIDTPPPERPTGGPVTPIVAGLLSDVRASIHDPLHDLLFPSQIGSAAWLSERIDPEELMVAIAREGLALAGQGEAPADDDLPWSRQRAPSDHKNGGDRIRDLKKLVEKLLNTAQEVRERTLDAGWSAFPAIPESAAWFEALRTQFLQAPLDGIDLRTPWLSDSNQGSTASCVGHAVAELIQRQRRLILDPPSARYIWQAAKELDADPRPTSMIAGAGTSLRAALSVVATHGYATELEIPSKNNDLYYGDLQDFYAGLKRRKAARVVNLGRDTLSWMAWLQAGRPLVMAISVGDKFLATKTQSPGKEPVIPTETGRERFSHAVVLMGYRPCKRPRNEGHEGGHAQDNGLTSYKNMKELLGATKGEGLPFEYLVRNSGGKEWGDQGYAWIGQATLIAQVEEGFGLLWKSDLKENPATA